MSNRESNPRAGLIWLSFALIVASWLATPILIPMFVDAKKYTEFGVFGDIFGSINALFSGLAFAMLIYAVLLQRKELELQRRELADTREVLTSQRMEAEKQNATLSVQTFDNTFFQLLRLHNDILNAVDLRGPTGTTTSQGRDCFKIFYDRLEKRWNKKNAEDFSELELDRIDKTYSALYLDIESDVGHYFRSLYNIIKFIDESDISNKKRYTNLVRAQLSTYELKMLYYNCLSGYGRSKFKPLIGRP